MRWGWGPAVAGFLTLGAASPARVWAGAVEQACASDLARWCGGERFDGPGYNAAVRCLLGSIGDLSGACRAWLQVGLDLADAMRSACDDGDLAVCADKGPGERGWLGCMREQRGALSPACQQAIAGDQRGGMNVGTW